MISRTLACLRKVQVTIPQLSPTHTKARIIKFCIPNHPPPDDHKQSSSTYIECYDPLFVLQCSPDLVTPGYRLYDDHCPLMIVEAHDEGIFKMVNNKDAVLLGEWYNVGHVIGVIDDGDDDDDDGIMSEWLWQAYAHIETEEQ